MSDKCKDQGTAKPSAVNCKCPAAPPPCSFASDISSIYSSIPNPLILLEASHPLNRNEGPKAQRDLKTEFLYTHGLLVCAASKAFGYLKYCIKLWLGAIVTKVDQNSLSSSAVAKRIRASQGSFQLSSACPLDRSINACFYFPPSVGLS